MKCPVCKEVNLSMTTRQNVEIDYCPECRGIWLDRGELDRLIERAESSAAPAPPAPPPQRDRAPSDYDDRDRGGDRDWDRDSDSRHPKRRKSLLGELFDF